jgi:hypothetical protein
MPPFSDAQRWVIPAILLLALLGVPVALWWEKRRPSVPDNVVELRAWRRRSTAEQAVRDAEALEAVADAEVGARADAAELAGLRALDSVVKTNAWYRP